MAICPALQPFIMLLSAGSGANPTGLVEVDGDCVVGAGGLWTAATCPGGRSNWRQPHSLDRCLGDQRPCHNFHAFGRCPAYRVNPVTNALAAQMPAHTIKGNNTAAPANAVDLTDAQAAAELPAFVGDSGSGGTKGSVPAPAAGDAAAGKFLAAGGGWSVPSGGGNVSTSGSISTGALGIWASGTGLAGTVIPRSGRHRLLSTPSSANLATAITDETGSGLAVFGTTPTLTIPVIDGGTMGASTPWTITSGTPTVYVGPRCIESSGNRDAQRLAAIRPPR